MNATAHARKLRKASTPEEIQLWRALRGRRFNGLRFRRQQPVGPYILDFYCSAARLSIELDGGSHGTPEGRAYDQVRTDYLEALDILELRIWNNELRSNFDGVLEHLAETIERRRIRPLTRRVAPPSPAGGEG